MSRICEGPQSGALPPRPSLSAQGTSRPRHKLGSRRSLQCCRGWMPAGKACGLASHRAMKPVLNAADQVNSASRRTKEYGPAPLGQGNPTAGWSVPFHWQRAGPRAERARQRCLLSLTQGRPDQVPAQLPAQPTASSRLGSWLLADRKDMPQCDLGVRSELECQFCWCPCRTVSDVFT